MLVLGIAFLVIAALLQYTSVTVIGAFVLVGAGCVILALVLGERLPTR